MGTHRELDTGLQVWSFLISEGSLGPHICEPTILGRTTTLPRLKSILSIDGLEGTKDMEFSSRGNGPVAVAKGPQVVCSSCMMQDLGRSQLPEPLGCAPWAPVKGWARGQHPCREEPAQWKSRGKSCAKGDRPQRGCALDAPGRGFFFISSASGVVHMTR